jgi:hypothetical protein
MEHYWNLYAELPTLMQIFWGCALISTIIMVIQFILSLCGMGDVDMDVDMSAGDGLDAATGMDLFSIKNVIIFFVGFGWAGISFREIIPQDGLLILAALACGCFFVASFIMIFKQLMKFEGNGAVNMSEAVGKKAEVYLRIPAKRNGKGKVQVSLNGVAREYDAVTNDDEMIPSGKIVDIIGSTGGGALLVTARLSQ